MNLTVNIIGTGNLGKTIGRLLNTHRLATIQGIYNRTPNHSIEGVQFIGAGTPIADITSLPPADIQFITTPDDAIADTCLQLRQNKNIKPNCIIVHCSGSLTSDILLPMKSLGCYVASIHPMHSFANPEISVMQYAGTFCSIEGDPQATKVMIPLFDAFGSQTYFIHKEKKLLAHVAGVFASNYLITLAQQALSCLQEAGVDEAVAMKIITHLMKGTVLNLEKTMSPEDSLTGPIQRGDTATIKNHLTALENSKQKELYALLGLATLDITRHCDEKLEVLKKIFDIK